MATSMPPGKLSIFNIPEVRTFLISLVTAGAMYLGTSIATGRESAVMFAERIQAHDKRISSLEDVTRSIASAQASQATTAASVAATQQAMAGILERTDKDIRELRNKVEAR